MDTTHNIEENLSKVEGLIAGVAHLNELRKELGAEALMFEIESLNALAEETKESLDTIRLKCKLTPNNERR